MHDIDEFDELQLYFGEDYFVSDKIIIHHPTLGEILQMGEREYFQMIHTLTCIPSNMKSMLWDAGIDYEEISDFRLFCMLAPGLSPEKTDILFQRSIDFTKFQTYRDTQEDRIIFADFDQNIIIDEFVYLKMVLYLRKIHGIKPKIERAGTKGTKELLIELDRQDILVAKSKPYDSQLLPLISSMLNSPGFKYSKKELKEVHYYEFRDSVKRIRTMQHADALLQGIYCGNIDGSKINKRELDGYRDLSRDA